MNLLVVDANGIYADTLVHVLEREGCRAQAASCADGVLALLRQHHYDVVLMDVQLAQQDGHAILRELYSSASRPGEMPRVCLMSNSPASVMLADARSEQFLEFLPADAAPILDRIRINRDSEVIIVAGVTVSPGFKGALLQEGYPVAVAHDIPSVLRRYFEGAYPVVFLEAPFVGMVQPGEVVVARRMNGRTLACMAGALTDRSMDCLVKPHRIAEISELVAKLRKDMVHPQTQAKTIHSIATA